MQTIKKFVFELEPDDDQRQIIHIYAGASRYVFNKGLVHLTEIAKASDVPIDYGELYEWLEEQINSNDTPWLGKVPRFLLISSIRNLIGQHQQQQQARDWEPVKFRKKGRTDTIYFYRDTKLDFETSCVLLPTIGWVRFLMDEKIPGKLKSVALSRRGKYWYLEVSMLVEEYPRNPKFISY